MPAPTHGHAHAPKVKPEVQTSPALSLFALPGEAGIRTRRVAILVAEGVDVAVATTLRDALLAAGAVPKIVGVRVGPPKPGSGAWIEADGSLSSMPAVIFDAAFVPGGDAAVDALCADGRAVEFVRDIYRHCKTLGAVGAGSRLLVEAKIIPGPSGAVDPGLVVAADASRLPDTVRAFTDAVARHRHFERETDPPRV